MAEAKPKTDMNWDLTSYFPEFDGPEMREFKEELKKDISNLEKKSSSLSPLLSENQTEWEEIFIRNEDILKRYSHIRSYVGCLSAADARNEDYLKEEAEISRLGAEFSKVEIHLLRALKDVPDHLFEEFADRKAFDGARYYLNRMREKAERRMTPEKEILATDLGVDGIKAWGRLYDKVSSKLEFDMEYPDGTHKSLPMSQRRSLMEQTDREIRKSAFEGGNRAWESIEDVCAGALNAISGTRLTLKQHRGVEHFLDIALFQAAISRETLDAMFEAIFSEIELPRRILHLKAKTMDSESIAWYDLGAPFDIPEQEEISWEKGKSLVGNSFKHAYPKLGNYINTMYEKDWIDWEPRAGKRPGGFCTGSLLTKESRIFMTFNNTIGDVSTLAHEAGHAFHSYVMREKRPYARLYPITLAESASTFGEMVLAEGVLENPSITNRQKALMLGAEVNDGAIFLLDIPVRYEFEKALYEERAEGELSVSRLKELMAETQKSVFGDVLEEYDPYFWASKLHFYITGITFYNFPYTFGYLLSRGLFAMFKKEGEQFIPRYEEFLRLTGSDTAENVVKRSIGRNLQSTDFWVEAIRSLEQPLEELEELLPKVV